MVATPHVKPTHCPAVNALNSPKKMPPDTMAKKMKLHWSTGMMNRGSNLLSADCARGEKVKEGREK
jgi:hypothetical protein